MKPDIPLAVGRADFLLRTAHGSVTPFVGGAEKIQVTEDAMRILIVDDESCAAVALAFYFARKDRR